MNNTERMNLVETLLEGPYFLLDILPEQVPPERGAEFFALEDLFLQERGEFGEKLTRILRKLWCYCDVIHCHGGRWEQAALSDLPGLVQRGVTERKGELCLLLDEGTLLTGEGDSLHVTVYAPTDKIQRILSALAWSEGLFWRRGG